MYRTVLLGVFATVMCLGVTAPLVFAKQVKHKYYCVQCDPPGSDNCEEFTESKAPNDRLLTILVTTILAGQREIRNELHNLPAKIKELCAPATPSNR